jgi:hypothetical protein
MFPQKLAFLSLDLGCLIGQHGVDWLRTRSR